MRESALAPLALAADGEAELEQEEVVEDEPPARRRLLGCRLGKVAGPEGRARAATRPRAARTRSGSGSSTRSA